MRRKPVEVVTVIVLLTVVLSLLQYCLPSLVTAQVLNQKVDSLLARNCTGLFPPTGTGLFPAGLQAIGIGPNLARICGSPQTQGATSEGGGAASVQGSAVSILNRALIQRMDETDEEEGKDHKRSSSLMFSPMGMVLGGLAGNRSVSSPFYASTTANGGSAASFSTSSQNRWNGLGFFATGLVESLNRDITTFQNGYKSTILGITAGADYRFNKKLVAGLALNYSNTDGDFSSGGGNFSTNSYGGLLFASYLPTDKSFLQITGGYIRNNYLVSRLASAFIAGNDPINPLLGSRNTSGTASSNSDGDVFNVGFLSGYDHPIGRFTVGPRAGLNWTNTHIHGYNESGSTGVELAYQDQYVNSLQSVLGIQGSAAFSTAVAVLVPQVNADYIHEFANSQRFINVRFAEDNRANPTFFRFQNDVPVRNYFNLGTGLLAVLPNGWQTFANFRAMVGNSQFNDYAGTFGLRIAM